ncbi:hypothetical protein ABBQ32_010895 [Trebouxia sp. C0010 RCD-2024]
MHLSTTPTSLVKYNATALRQDLPSHFISTRPAFRCSNWTHRCFWHLQSGIFSSPSDKRRAGRVHAAAGVPTNNAPATAAVPLLLAQSYFALQHPAVLNMRYSQAVKEFAEAAVTAYECGYAEDTLRQELARATEEPSTSDNVKVTSWVSLQTVCIEVVCKSSGMVADIAMVCCIGIWQYSSVAIAAACSYHALLS